MTIAHDDVIRARLPLYITSQLSSTAATCFSANLLSAPLASCPGVFSAGLIVLINQSIKRPNMTNMYLSPMMHACAGLLQLLVLLLTIGGNLSAANHMTLGVDEEFRTSFQESKVMDIPDPTDIEFSPDGNLMLVTTKVGKLWAITNFANGDGDNNSAQKTEVLDISTRLCTNGERGLGGVAFHPQFGRANHWVYLYYTFENDSDCYADGELGKGPVNRLSRLDMPAIASGENGDVTHSIDVDSEVIYFETPPLPKNHHNSGDIAFGKDGYLYVTVGDGGTRTDENKDGVPYPQALDKLLGKIVRLTDLGEIPPDNPYTPSNGHSNSARCSLTGGEAEKAEIKCQEIYASGLRNPWRFAHDPNADEVRFFINDVGRKTWERILDGEMGANYGYPFREGPCEATEEKNCKPDARYKDPAHWYKHDAEDGGAVTGAAWYPNDAGWPESFAGSYLYAEYASGGIFRIKENTDECSFPKCDPPISNFASSTQVLSGLKKVVSMAFGPYRDVRKALYVVSRGHTGNRGNEGVFRVAFTGESTTMAQVESPEGSANIPLAAVTNRGPAIAKAEASPQFGFAPLTVEFSALALDVDGDDLVYSWDFDGDGETDAKSPRGMHVFKSSGTYEAILTVKDGRGGKETATVVIEVANTPPTPQIESPEDDFSFNVGDKIKLVGSAIDVEDGDDMPKLSWEVIIHHKDHFHQFLPPTEGKKVKFEAPAPIDLSSASSSYLVAKLTAKDSNGLSTTVERIIRPEIADVRIDSEPSGLTIVANEESFVTPAVIKSWSGQTLSLEPPKYQILDGIEYAFNEWTDGGRRQSIKVSSSRSSGNALVAKFRRTSPFVDIGKPADDSTFAIGDVLALTGDAKDASGEALSDESLSWEVKLYREENDDSAFETVLKPTEGRYVEKKISDIDVYSLAPELSRLEVILTATDPSGATATKTVNLRPRKIEVTFNSSPVQGLYLRIDGLKYTTPVTLTTWENHIINVKAPSQHGPMYDDDDDITENGIMYAFDSWSDGGDQTHDYVASSMGGEHNVITANFRPSVVWTNEIPKANNEEPLLQSMGPAASRENSRNEGIGMIVVSASVFIIAASVCFWKISKTARSRHALHFLAAQKNLSYLSGDASTAEGTPTPIGSPNRGSIIMDGFDLNDSFEESDDARAPSPTGSMKFGDDGYMRSADLSDISSSSPVPSRTDSLVKALSFMRGDLV